MTFTPGQAVNDRAGKRGERDEGDYLGQHGSRDAHPRAGQVQHEEGDGGELDDVTPLAHRPGRPQPPVGGPGEHRRSPVAAGVAGVGPLAHAASLPGVARGRSPPGRLWRRRAQVELPSPGRADRAGERLNSDIRPGVGFDCSGLVQAAYKVAGISLPRVAQDQYDGTAKLGLGNPVEPGDLIFFGGGPGDVNNVGIYVGNGQMVDAPHTGADVRVEATPTTSGSSWGTDVVVGVTDPAK